MADAGNRTGVVRRLVVAEWPLRNAESEPIHSGRVAFGRPSPLLIHFQDNPAISPQPPHRNLTRKLYRRWRDARRGSDVAQNLSNPYWDWMFRGRIDPFQSHQFFQSRFSRLLGGSEFPSEPRWAGCRLGQSRTELQDGRVLHIAGEHEDHYDPDFYIYNDVIIQHPDGRVEILGYPVDHFLPTDFHTATLTPCHSEIVLIGNLGYPEHRHENRTQVYVLDVASMHFRKIETSGEQPGWISKHRASLTMNADAIEIEGGEIYSAPAPRENIDRWQLSLGSFEWTRLTKRSWPRFHVSRKDGQMLHLWNYDMLEFREQAPDFPHDSPFDLESEIGCVPDMEAFRTLYTPSIDHTPLPGPDAESAEDEDDAAWRTTGILHRGIRIRYVDEMDRLCVTAEGQVEESVMQTLAEETREKLSRLENCPCEIQWINES